MKLPPLHFEDLTRDVLTPRTRGKFVALFWIFLFSPAAAFARSIYTQARNWIPGIAITATGGFAVWLITFFFLFPESKVSKQSPQTPNATATPMATPLTVVSSDAAVSDILAKCYTQALFTRTQSELGRDAMFKSIEESRKTVQAGIPKIQNAKLRGIAIELLATFDDILQQNSVNFTSAAAIDQSKLRALNAFQQLALSTGGVYPLAASGVLAPSRYFTQAEADAPPSVNEINSAAPSPSVTKTPAPTPTPVQISRPF
jgi:hypothetical protein